MSNKFFGSLGEKAKGNALIIILAVAVIGAGVYSYNTVNDINDKLKDQQLQDITVTNPPSQEQEVTDTQTEQNNVPLPQKTTAPTPSTSPTISPSPSPTAPITETVTQPKFTLPVDGKIYAAFSGNELVYNRTLDDWRTHNGVDITATKDSAVYSGADGEVKAVYEDGLLGYVVEIQHTDFLARYCGLNVKTFVKVGDSVKQGQSIGSVGTIPLELSDESHIHLEIIVDGVAIDPKNILN